MSALIAVGATSVICFALIAHVQNRSRRRARAGAGADGGGDSYSGTSDGFSLGSWFSSDNSSLDSSGNPTDGGSCSFGSDSSDSGGGGGDCGGGGDGGGGGGGD
ncbi:hypothetical protein GCM10007857_89330 [Bradyrhizobium iriomotense]|uniref:Loricrin n=2 Tax=Bradyrhizobium iriomotense TaxID=441950 RepID=A0ABQ6BD13_9BRAD|nr:hypothetical protein GCM10007857_89330 [Bradyrhizobium iriomotense]